VLTGFSTWRGAERAWLCGYSSCQRRERASLCKPLVASIENAEVLSAYARVDVSAGPAIALLASVDAANAARASSCYLSGNEAVDPAICASTTVFWALKHKSFLVWHGCPLDKPAYTGQACLQTVCGCSGGKILRQNYGSSGPLSSGDNRVGTPSPWQNLSSQPLDWTLRFRR